LTVGSFFWERILHTSIPQRRKQGSYDAPTSTNSQLSMAGSIDSPSRYVMSATRAHSCRASVGNRREGLVSTGQQAGNCRHLANDQGPSSSDPHDTTSDRRILERSGLSNDQARVRWLTIGKLLRVRYWPAERTISGISAVFEMGPASLLSQHNRWLHAACPPCRQVARYERCRQQENHNDCESQGVPRLDTE